MSLSLLALAQMGSLAACMVVCITLFLSNLYDRRKLSEIQHTRTKTFSNFTGMGGLPYGGQILGMGAEKSNTKYGECLSVMFYHSTVA